MWERPLRRDGLGEGQKSGAQRPLPYWLGSIRLAQHWVVEGPFAITRFAVVPVIDLEIALHFQMAAVGCGPFAEEMRAVAIEHELVGARAVLHRDVDGPFSGFV